MAIPVTSGLQLLIDARDQAVVADGAALSSVSDSSGQGNTASQSTSARQPLYKTNVFGSGLPAIRFAGTDDSLYGSFAAWGTGTGTGFTLLLAMTAYASTIDYAGLIAVHPGSGDDYQQNNAMAWACGPSAGQTSTNNFATRRTGLANQGTGGATIGTASPVLPTKPAVVGVGMSASAWACCDSAGVVTSGSHSKTIATGTAGYVVANRYLAGAVSTTSGSAYDLGVAAVYNRLLSDTEAASVCQWMAQRIGVLTASTPTPTPTRVYVG